ncbi:unnamed protein product [Brassica rapa subsp. narinosa]
MNKRKQKTHRKLYLKINDSTTPNTGERRLRKLSRTVRSPQLKRLESGPLDPGPHERLLWILHGASRGTC